MNAFNLSRDLTCAAAATLITVMLGLSFVQSTSVAPGSRCVSVHLASAQAPSWSGQPEPAVLVD